MPPMSTTHEVAADGHLDAPPSIARRRGDAIAVGVLVVAILTWIITFGTLVILRQHRFGSFDFDMGIHDQNIWLLAHGRGFNTVCGLQVFAHHAALAYYLLVPFSWVGGGPHLWNLFQVVALGVAAVPLFLLGRFRTGTAWVGTGVAVVYLLHPALGFLAWELFHPEVPAIALLFAAYYCSVRKRWGWFAVWAVFAVAWKEDAALVVMVLGLIIALRGDRRVGLWTAGLALAWLSLWLFVLFPVINHGQVQSEFLYTEVGGSPSGILRTALTHPGRIAGPMTDREAGDYYWRLGAPYGFVPLLSPLVLVAALPQLVLNLVTNVPWTKTITYHYTVFPLVAATLALVESIGWLWRRVRWRSVAIAVLAFALVCSMLTTLRWGLSPIGDQYRSWWPLTTDPRVDTLRRDLDRIPSDAAVSATYNIVPHLSRRPEIYSFPNPWVARNFLSDASGRSPRQIDWLIADRNLLGPQDAGLLDRILARGTLEIVSEADGYVLAHRVTR